MKIFLLKNFLSLAGAEAVSKFAAFLAFAYLGRVFGVANYGFVEWAGSVLMCASLVVDQGFSSYGAREIAKDPNRTRQLVSEIVTARSLLAVISYAGILLFAFLSITTPELRDLVTVFGLSLWLLPLLLQWVFQGHDRMHLVSVTQILRQTVFAAIVFIFVSGPADLVRVGWAEVAAVAAAASLSLFFYFREFAGASGFRPVLSRQLFREGTPIGLSQLFWVVKMFGATLIIGIVATAEDTGYFGAAMRIFIAVHTFVWLYFFNLLPSLSRAWQNRRPEFAALIRSSMWIVLAVGVLAGSAGVLLSPWIMSLAYGSDFAYGGTALRWLGGACFIAAISGHFRFGLIAAGHQKREMLSSAIGAAAVAVLVPVGYFGNGITGAAMGLCGGELLILVSSWLFARRSLFGVNTEGSSASEHRFNKIPEAVR